VNQMYGVRPPHYVIMQDIATTKIDPGAPLWRLTNGVFVPAYY